ncbi:hypothetical protein HYY75_07960 [bacterium]|nr:hypothetical protein [bacterium]
MNIRKAWFIAAGGVLFSLLFSGCNLFDAVDTTLAARTVDQRVDEGRLALNSGDFPLAKEIFDSLAKEGEGGIETIRGQGEAIAGLGGFSLLSVLDALQNGSGPYDKSPVTFKTAKQTSNRPYLETAVKLLMQNPMPVQSDLIARALMRLVSAVRVLLDKYDTNRNGRLESNDEIDFDTNDKNTPSWVDLYKDLVTGPSSTDSTLEQTFLDLVNGFDGQGATWTFITPVEGRLLTGQYTPSNRATILAVGDLVNRLQAANPVFEVNLSSFSVAIMNLDGAE